MEGADDGGCGTRNAGKGGPVLPPPAPTVSDNGVIIDGGGNALDVVTTSSGIVREQRCVLNGCVEMSGVR